MQLWYDFCHLLPVEMLQWDFMCNALLAVLLIAPLFGLTSTMIVTGKMSFFSDALGHSAFTGIAIGCICGISTPTWAAVIFSVAFALLFSFLRSRSSHAADTLIGVFSSAAVALGIFVATLGGNSFTKYNKYLIGDILSVTPAEILWLAIVLLCMIVFLIFFSNRLTLSAIHPAFLSGILSGSFPNNVHYSHCRDCYTFHFLGWLDDSQFPFGLTGRVCPEYCPEFTPIPRLLRSVCSRGRNLRPCGFLLSWNFIRCSHFSGSCFSVFHFFLL